MKCPMCGSVALEVYVCVKFEWSQISDSHGLWITDSPVGNETIKDESPVECECGWTGEVKDLEKSEKT